MDAVQLAAGNAQIARMFGAAGEQQRMMLAPQILHRYIPADMGVGPEPHPLRQHLLQPPVDKVLLHLEIRDAVTQQAADAVGLLEYRHIMAGARQLLRGRQASRSGTDNRDAFPRAYSRRLGRDAALRESPVDNRLLNLFNSDRRRS